jgi:hypothetical protein
MAYQYPMQEDSNLKVKESNISDPQYILYQQFVKLLHVSLHQYILSC